MAVRVGFGLALVVSVAGCSGPLGGGTLQIAGAGLAGGVLYRQRGGGVPLPIGTQGARLVWSVPTGAIVASLAGRPDRMPGTVAAAFGGLLLGHGAHQRSGAGLVAEDPAWQQMEAQTRWLGMVFGPYDRDWPAWRKEAWHYAGMTSTQALRLALLVAPVVPHRPRFGLVPLAAVLPTYWLGWRLPSTLPHLRQGTEVGEFLTGVATTIAVLLAARG